MISRACGKGSSRKTIEATDPRGLHVAGSDPPEHRWRSSFDSILTTHSA